VKHDSQFGSSELRRSHRRSAPSQSESAADRVSIIGIFPKSLPKRVALPSFQSGGRDHRGLSLREPHSFASSLSELFKSLPEEKRFKGATRGARKSATELCAHSNGPFLTGKFGTFARTAIGFRGIETHLEELGRRLREFPPSLRKLEWNCQGEERIFGSTSCSSAFGLRVKRYTSCPALVAMTTTQIPILGPSDGFLPRKRG